MARVSVYDAASQVELQVRYSSAVALICCSINTRQNQLLQKNHQQRLWHRKFDCRGLFQRGNCSIVNMLRVTVNVSMWMVQSRSDSIVARVGIDHSVHYFCCFYLKLSVLQLIPCPEILFLFTMS